MRLPLPPALFLLLAPAPNRVHAGNEEEDGGRAAGLGFHSLAGLEGGLRNGGRDTAVEAGETGAGRGGAGRVSRWSLQTP